MALFSATIGRDSVSLLRFPFRSHVYVFSCAISIVCNWKYLYSRFSSDFCFLAFVTFLSVLILPVLLLAVTIIIIIYSLEFSPQLKLNLQDFSQYSGRSQ